MKKNPIFKIVLMLSILFFLSSCESLQQTSSKLFSAIDEPQLAFAQKSAEVTIDYAAGGQPVKDMLFGTNIEWVDNGDSIWNENTNDFDLQRLEAISQTRPTSLRFPGGVHADTYHWKYAVGNKNARQSGKHYYKTERIPSNFGTDEFLQLCKRLNARPIFTLNIVSGTPREAAEWVSYVKTVTKKNNYPPVLYWEVGNEPYLENKFGRLSPQNYTHTYVEFFNAIKKVDPHAPMGALFVGREIEEYYRGKNGQGWNEALLNDAASSINYASIHNAYYPGFIFNIFMSNDDVFKKTLGSLKKLKDDFTWLEQLIANRPIKIDISEYNSFFGINTRFDSYVSSLGGALYVANVIQEFMNTPSVQVANYWSMLDNWYFGLVFGGKIKRPNFYVFKLYTQMEGKTILPVPLTIPTELKMMAVKDGKSGEMLVYVINNDLQSAFHLKLSVQNFNLKGNVSLQTIFANSILANNDSGTEQVRIEPSSIAASNPFEVDINPHSIVLLRFSNQ